MKILAALRLMLTAEVEITQDEVDSLMPKMFNAEFITKNLTQREKVDLRLPFPYKDVWYASLHGNALYVSVNAETYGLWCCAFACEYGVRGLPVKGIDMKAFIQPVLFNSFKGDIEAAVDAAFTKVRPRIIRWYTQQSKTPWRAYEHDTKPANNELR